MLAINAEVEKMFVDNAMARPCTKVGVKSSENCATGRTKLSAERPYFTALLH
jgi:hypothetical protein